MMCYEKSCRLCLKELRSPGIDCFTISELRETISKFFDVEIRRSDTSKGICNKCFQNVMSFRAFQKSVAECQKIISDYENIKKKVLQNRMLSVKQEVIELSDAEDAAPPPQKRKRNEVTDTQINDILAIVHDKSNSSGNAGRTTPLNTKTMTPTLTAPSTNPRTSIKIEPKDNAPICAPSTSQLPESTTTSGNNTDTIPPVRTSPTPRSDSTCSTSTSGIGSSLDRPKTAKKEPQSGTVSSSAQSPTSSTPDPKPTQETPIMQSPRRLTKENDTPAPHPQAKKREPSKQKQKKNLDETCSLYSFSGGDKAESILGRRRSCRQAKSQAIKKIGEGAKRRQSLSPNAMRRTEPTSEVLNGTSRSSLDPNPPTTSTIEAQRLIEKKRIITITLVRSKDPTSLNFRYCDQYKNIIEFNTISMDELDDIRKSLTIPEIWANLQSAFKTTPPDAKTVDELKIIFGGKFII